MKLYETINAENWIKGRGFDEGGRRCLSVSLGDIRLAEAVIEAIKTLYPDRLGRTPGFRIRDFNDHPDTTVEDVIRVCKVADV